MNFKPGDLVMVVKPRPCCGNSDTVGHGYTVIEGLRLIRECFCPDCGHREGNSESL